MIRILVDSASDYSLEEVKEKNIERKWRIPKNIPAIPAGICKYIPGC